MSFTFNYPGTPYFLPTSSIIDISASILTGSLPPNTFFTISPVPPAGLNINSATGTISGTTTYASISNSRTYVVDASYSNAITSTTLDIGVNFLPSFSYPLTPYIIQEDVFTSIVPIYLVSNIPGVVYTLSPGSPLLSDISMNLRSTDGLISGTPSSYSPLTAYIIQANNRGIIYETTLSINVLSLPVISYPQSIYILTQGIPINIVPVSSINNTGVVYSINGCILPTGLFFDTATGKIYGTPTLPNTYRQYTVTITNVIGSTNVNIILNVIKVTLAPPVVADNINAGLCLTNPIMSIRRKAEILKYKKNSSGLTKNQYLSLIVQGKGPYAKRVWANQNDLGSNPNISTSSSQGSTIICNTNPIICTPTSSSDIPGPITTLCYNPRTPLIGYGQPNRTRVNIGFKWPQRTWQIGDMGFPIGKAGSDIGSG